MANRSVSSLTEATGVNNNDLFVLEQGGTAKKLAGQYYKNYLINTVEPYSTSAANSAASAAADRSTVESIAQSIGSALVYKGVVATLSDLPSNARAGDTYFVTAQNSSYAYNGTTWQDIGSTNIDGGTF